MPRLEEHIPNNTKKTRIHLIMDCIYYGSIAQMDCNCPASSELAMHNGFGSGIAVYATS